MALTDSTDTFNVLGKELSAAEFNMFVYVFKATQPIQIQGAAMFMKQPESPKKLQVRLDVLRKHKLVQSELRPYRIGLRSVQRAFFWVPEDVRNQVSEDANLASLIKQH